MVVVANKLLPDGAVRFSSSASSFRKLQNVRKHWLAAANDAALTDLVPYSQNSPQRDKTSISKRPFSVIFGEHAIDRNSRKTFTTVSSLLFPAHEIPFVERSSCAGSQFESSSGSKPMKNLSSLMSFCKRNLRVNRRELFLAFALR